VNHFHDFWHATWSVWRSGSLDSVTPYFRQDASRPFEEWRAANAYAKDPASARLLATYPPLTDEFFIASQVEGGELGLFITNRRFWLAERKGGPLVEYSFDELQSYEAKTRWSGIAVSMTFASGTTKSYDVVPMAPDPGVVRLILTRRTSPEAWLAPAPTETPDARRQSRFSVPAAAVGAMFFALAMWGLFGGVYDTGEVAILLGGSALFGYGVGEAAGRMWPSPRR
jgi:hypothetical protein